MDGMEAPSEGGRLPGRARGRLPGGQERRGSRGGDRTRCGSPGAARYLNGVYCFLKCLSGISDLQRRQPHEQEHNYTSQHESFSRIKY